jgi:Holliday junction resolvase RusA-like endonuclease
MSSELIIVVYGRPAPQGSKRAFSIRKGGVHTGRVAMVEQTSSTLKPWREAVKTAALEARNGRPPLDGPLSVGITFFLGRPKGHYGTGRNAEQLRDSAPSHPAGMPDLSKLARSTEDALTDAGIWTDDARIVDEQLSKHYAGQTAYLNVPGARIAVCQLT